MAQSASASPLTENWARLGLVMPGMVFMPITFVMMAVPQNREFLQQKKAHQSAQQCPRKRVQVSA